MRRNGNRRGGRLEHSSLLSDLAKNTKKMTFRGKEHFVREKKKRDMQSEKELFSLPQRGNSPPKGEKDFARCSREGHQ